MYLYPNGIGVIYQLEDDGPGLMSGTMITGNVMEIENVETPCGFEDGKLIFSYRDMAESICYPALKKDSFSCFRKRSAIGVKA